MLPRLLALLWLLAASLLAPASPSYAEGECAATAPGPYAEQAVATWRDGDPVHVSDESGALSADDADELRDRITGWRDDVFVAVLPATAIRQGDQDDAGEASALIDDLYEAMCGEAGIYLVNLSGAGTYAAGYGDAAGAGEVGRIVADEVGSHTLGQVDQVLDGTLDELGAPDDGGVSVGWVLVGVLVGAAVAAASTVAVLRWRRRPRTRPSGETWAGPAAYRPSFATYGDQADTVEDRAALAREDVTRLGEELDAADPPLTDPAVATHVQAALDAYADASRRVDSLTRDDELRQLAQVILYARWQLACAEARLAGTPAPPRRLPCFIDMSHGPSVADASWAPPGGTLRPVPVCGSCYERITQEQA